MKVPEHDDVERILVLKWSAMGDVVISAAALEDIARAFPGRSIDLNTMSPWDALFRDDPRLDEVFTIDLRGKERGWRGISQWLRRVRAKRYDMVIDLQSSDHTRMLLTLLSLSGRGIRYRVGNVRGYPYNVSPKTQDAFAPAHENVRHTLAAAGIAATTERPVLHVPQEAIDRATSLLIEAELAKDAYVVFLPGSQAAGYLKRWGAARYAALGRRLHSEEGLSSVLLGGPDDFEECAAIEAQSGDWLVNLCGRTELLDLVPLCAWSRYIVGNDTGTAHIASTTTRPMVVICGPTDPRRVRPMGENVVTLQTEGLDCINCYCRRPCAHHSCMTRIDPEAVHRKTCSFLLSLRI